MVAVREVALFATLFGAPCFYILWHCAKDPSLFAVHPASNAIAFLICTPAALFIMLERKQTKKHPSRVLMTKLHLGLHLIAGTLMGVGGAAAFQVKRINDKPHFKSVHSWAALTTSSFFILNVLQGLLLTYEKKPANWQWKDETHVLVGTLVYIGSAVTMVYGVHSGTWGSAHFGTERQLHLSIAIGLAHIVLLGKALVSSRPQTGKAKGS